MDKIAVRGLYAELGSIQEKLSDLGEMYDWRQDWRGWQYDPECGCTRCNGRTTRQFTVGEGVYGKI